MRNIVSEKFYIIKSLKKQLADGVYEGLRFAYRALALSFLCLNIALYARIAAVTIRIISTAITAR